MTEAVKTESLPDHQRETMRRAEEAGVDLKRLPRHVAVIMDGNGRWARAANKPRI